jgi:adenylate kinase
MEQREDSPLKKIKMEKMLNIVLFGPPGAGKGTQSENLINKYGLVHLSTGDILRTEIARGTDLGRKAKEIMDRGELVGDDIVIGMIESKLDENTGAKGFIFDGFPRTIAQAVALDDLLQKKGTGISGMLALEVDDEELVKRLLIRGEASGRPDDRNEGIIRRRIEEYNNKTLPLKNYYSEQGKFHSINGIGSIDEIFKLLVDRITFLNAEMDLTALETDLEHLDLTIQDFDVADEIAPELLLEIDAIKRSEAEEEEEERELKKQTRKDSKVPGLENIVAKKAKVAVTPAKKAVAPKKKAKPAKKAKPKPTVKSKPAVKAKAKKPVAASKKAPLKKSAAKKAAKTPARKPAKALKKAVKKTPAKKATKKIPSKKIASKKAAKKVAKKTTTKKAAKKSAKRK